MFQTICMETFELGEVMCVEEFMCTLELIVKVYYVVGRGGFGGF